MDDATHWTEFLFPWLNNNKNNNFVKLINNYDTDSYDNPVA